MNVHQQGKIDFVLVGSDRAEVQVVVQLVDETGRVVANDQRYMVPFDAKTRDTLLAGVKGTVEQLVKQHQVMDQPMQPAKSAEKAVKAADGTELRPALAAVPEQPQTFKKLIPDGTVIVW